MSLIPGGNSFAYRGEVQYLNCIYTHRIGRCVAPAFMLLILYLDVDWKLSPAALEPSRLHDSMYVCVVLLVSLVRGIGQKQNVTVCKCKDTAQGQNAAQGKKIK